MTRYRYSSSMKVWKILGRNRQLSLLIKMSLSMKTLLTFCVRSKKVLLRVLIAYYWLFFFARYTLPYAPSPSFLTSSKSRMLNWLLFFDCSATTAGDSGEELIML